MVKRVSPELNLYVHDSNARNIQIIAHMEFRHVHVFSRGQQLTLAVNNIIIMIIRVPIFGSNDWPRQGILSYMVT